MAEREPWMDQETCIISQQQQHLEPNHVAAFSFILPLARMKQESEKKGRFTLSSTSMLVLGEDAFLGISQ